jgi:hypothetical protein
LADVMLQCCDWPKGAKLRKSRSEHEFFAPVPITDIGIWFCADDASYEFVHGSALPADSLPVLQVRALKLLSRLGPRSASRRTDSGLCSALSG